MRNKAWQYWVPSIILLLAALWLGNTAAFSWWASWGPPNPHAETYGLYAILFGLLSFFCFVLSLIIWFLGRRAVKRRAAADRD